MRTPEGMDETPSVPRIHGIIVTMTYLARHHSASKMFSVSPPFFCSRLLRIRMPSVGYLGKVALYTIQNTRHGIRQGRVGLARCVSEVSEPSRKETKQLISDNVAPSVSTNEIPILSRVCGFRLRLLIYLLYHAYQG